MVYLDCYENIERFKRVLVILDDNRSHVVVYYDIRITVALSRHVWFLPVNFIDLAENF